MTAAEITGPAKHPLPTSSTPAVIIFFNYIFNPADAYITTGVALLFIFSKTAFPKEEKVIE